MVYLLCAAACGAGAADNKHSGAAATGDQSVQGRPTGSGTAVRRRLPHLADVDQPAAGRGMGQRPRVVAGRMGLGEAAGAGVLRRSDALHDSGRPLSGKPLHDSLRGRGADRHRPQRESQSVVAGAHPRGHRLLRRRLLASTARDQPAEPRAQHSRRDAGLRVDL